MWRRRPPAKPEEIATIPLETPRPMGQPEPFQDHSLPNPLMVTHAEPPTIAHVPAFASKRRRRPLLLSLTVVVLASLLLGAGTLLAQQHVGNPTHQTAIPVSAGPTATPLPPLPNF